MGKRPTMNLVELSDLEGIAIVMLNASACATGSGDRYAEINAQDLARYARRLKAIADRHRPAVEKTLTCASMGDCDGSAVTHIDEKGYVYCALCGNSRRQSGVRCRRMTAGEIHRAKRGEPFHYSRELTR